MSTIQTINTPPLTSSPLPPPHPHPPPPPPPSLGPRSPGLTPAESSVLLGEKEKEKESESLLGTPSFGEQLLALSPLLGRRKPKQASDASPQHGSLEHLSPVGLGRRDSGGLTERCVLLFPTSCLLLYLFNFPSLSPCLSRCTSPFVFPFHAFSFLLGGKHREGECGALVPGGSGQERQRRVS